MKVIIVNNEDSHAYAIEYTAENMRKCLQHLVDIRYDMQEPERAAPLLESGTAEQIEAFLRNWNGPVDRSCGGQLHFVDVQAEWTFLYGPWS